MLAGTKFLPSLAEKRWEPSSQNAQDGIGKSQQLQIKWARLRVEILKQESDPQAKYELFQRLNTGGAELSEQEVRNCVAVMLSKEFHDWLQSCSQSQDFQIRIDQTETVLQKQSAMELALRFFVFRNVPYQPGLDVHEFLNDAMIEIAISTSINRDSECDIFNRTFVLLRRALAEKAFKRWNGEEFSGKFLMSVFEVTATGVSKNLQAIEQMTEDEQDSFICERSKTLWDNPIFQKNSGAGIRGTTRLANLLPIADELYRP